MKAKEEKNIFDNFWKGCCLIWGLVLKQWVNTVFWQYQEKDYEKDIVIRKII